MACCMLRVAPSYRFGCSSGVHVQKLASSAKFPILLIVFSLRIGTLLFRGGSIRVSTRALQSAAVQTSATMTGGAICAIIRIRRGFKTARGRAKRRIARGKHRSIFIVLGGMYNGAGILRDGPHILLCPHHFGMQHATTGPVSTSRYSSPERVRSPLGHKGNPR